MLQAQKCTNRMEMYVPTTWNCEKDIHEPCCSYLNRHLSHAIEVCCIKQVSTQSVQAWQAV